MCLIDVSVFECGDYTLQMRGPACPNALSNSPCSQPDVYGIVSRSRSCVRCLYARSLETLISINESMLNWERKCAADAVLRKAVILGEGRLMSPTTIEEHERAIQELKAKLEVVRVVKKFPLQFSGGTELSRRSQMLAILKFQAQETRSILLADAD